MLMRTTDRLATVDAIVTSIAMKINRSGKTYELMKRQ